MTEESQGSADLQEENQNKNQAASLEEAELGQSHDQDGDSEHESSATGAAPSDDSEAAPGVDSPDSDSMIALRAKVSSLEAQLTHQTEEVLRAQAEVQNVRRRAEKDVEGAHKFALEKFVNELLPVIDSLERGLESVPSDDEAQKASREGLSLTLKMFLDALKKFKVEQIDPQGEAFDPQLHQAMSMQESEELEPNTVVAVLQKGFTLSGRLVRPAMVMVSKAPAGVGSKGVNESA